MAVELANNQIRILNDVDYARLNQEIHNDAFWWSGSPETRKRSVISTIATALYKGKFDCVSSLFYEVCKRQDIDILLGVFTFREEVYKIPAYSTWLGHFTASLRKYVRNDLARIRQHSPTKEAFEIVWNKRNKTPGYEQGNLKKLYSSSVSKMATLENKIADIDNEILSLLQQKIEKEKTLAVETRNAEIMRQAVIMNKIVALKTQMLRLSVADARSEKGSRLESEFKEMLKKAVNMDAFFMEQLSIIADKELGLTDSKQPQIETQSTAKQAQIEPQSTAKHIQINQHDLYVDDSQDIQEQQEEYEDDEMD